MNNQPIEANIFQDLRSIKETIALSSHILSRDPSQLASQLTGRLLNERSPAVQRLLNGTLTKKEPWLRPLTASLDTIHGACYRTLIGHTGLINALAVLPGSRLAASAAADGTLRIWDIEKGSEIASYEDRAINFTAVSITPDGSQVVAGSADGFIHIWAWESGSLNAIFSAHPKAVRGIACTPDGQAFVSASNDGTLRVWDLDKHHLLQTLSGHTGPVNAVVITPEGCRAISASADRTVRLWRLSDGAELAKLESAWAQFAVAISPDGRTAVSGSEMVPIAWDLATGSQTILTGFNGPFHQEDVLGVAITPDGRQVISASSDATLRIWNLNGPYPLHTRSLPIWAAHSSNVKAVVVTPDGRWALSASFDKTIKVWNLVDPQNPALPVQSTAHGYPVKWLGFDPRGEPIQLKVGYIEDKFGEDPEWISVLEAAGATFDWNYRARDVAQTTDRRQLVIAVGNGINKIDLALKNQQGSGPFGVWSKIALSPDGSFALCYSGRSSLLQAWNLSTGSTAVLDAEARDVEALAISADNRWGVAGTSDGILRIWSLPDLAQSRALKVHNAAIKALLADKTGHILTCGEDGLVRVVDILQSQALWTFKLAWTSCHSLHISENGRWIAAVSKSGAAIAWDLLSGELLGELAERSLKIDGIMNTDLAGKPLANLALLNRRLWAAVSDGTTLRLLDLTGGQSLAAFTGDDEFESCAVSPDDSMLVIGTSSGKTHHLAIEASGLQINMNSG